MSRKHRSVKEKLMVLQEAEVEGVVVTCRKYGIDTSTYYVWKDRYEEEGIEGLQPRGKGKVDPEVKALRAENERLKRLLAEKELALQVKEELLKKVSRRERKK
jgi:putative transposase